MNEEKKARLAWASTGRSASALDTILRSGQPADAQARLAAAVAVKGGDEKEAAGYEIDSVVADAVFDEHCEAMKATVDDAVSCDGETQAPAEDGGDLETATEGVAALDAESDGLELSE